MNAIPKPAIIEAEALWEAACRAAYAIAPAWPLQATVAVNPFLGQSHLRLQETAAQIGRLSGAELFPSRKWHWERLERQLTSKDEIALALERIPIEGISEPNDLLTQMRGGKIGPTVLPDLTVLAARASGLDWPRIIAERIATFTNGYFDEGQALWASEQGKGLYAGWRLFAMHDLTPEIAGLRGFPAEVAGLPLSARDMINLAGERLGLEQDPGSYFHQLLLGLGGVAQYARHLQFVAERDGGGDGTILELLAIRLAFEVSLLRLYGDEIGDGWRTALAEHRKSSAPDRDMLIDAVLLEAAELADARRLASKLEWSSLAQRVAPVEGKGRPWVQAAFCIDVRSEVFRRAFETVDEGVKTIGFAGFFGMGVAHRAAASDLLEHRLPVLLPAGSMTCESVQPEADRAERYRARASRAFGRFRQAAVSSFAFVEASGLAYVFKLASQTFRLNQKTSAPARPTFSNNWSLDQRVKTAETILRAMSLTEDFAPIVLLAGHGAASANNPFLSALQCGACGGHAGDVNARLLASLLNDADVRAGLFQCGIKIPTDTLFIAGLHNTTTDDVTLFLDDVDSSAQQQYLSRLADCLKVAGRLARMERAKRLPHANTSPARLRSRDWAETRAEWGLAGCTSFIAAPRDLTIGCSLESKAFLHDYVWQKDAGFRVLETILTAPVVVANWINLQYYGSSVAPSLFGSGNKLLHNVVGGIGVLEGNGGSMRAGLPWQSVHDGERLVHEPLRLSVFIAAPTAPILDILKRHGGVRQLFDQGWMHLFLLNDNDGPLLQYAGNLAWREISTPLGPDARSSTMAAS